jgi:hypothetical protein
MADALQPVWDFFGAVLANPVYILGVVSLLALLPLLYFYWRFKRARENQKWERTSFGVNIGPHGKR